MMESLCNRKSQFYAAYHYHFFYMMSLYNIVFESLILASASPRRQELLKSAHIPFTLCPADVVEDEDPLADPITLVTHNASLKAHAVAKAHPSELILAADTTVALDGHVFNKPADLAEARVILRMLSGKTHTVFTAVHLLALDAKVDEAWVAQATVTFKDLDEQAIDNYIQLVNPLDKAGAYGIQAHAELIISGFTGLRSTIMGLPIEELLPRLKTYL